MKQQTILFFVLKKKSFGVSVWHASFSNTVVKLVLSVNAYV